MKRPRLRVVLRGNFYMGPSKFYPGQARVGPGVATPLHALYIYKICDKKSSCILRDRTLIKINHYTDIIDKYFSYKAFLIHDYNINLLQVS